LLGVAWGGALAYILLTRYREERLKRDGLAGLEEEEEGSPLDLPLPLTYLFRPSSAPHPAWLAEGGRGASALEDGARGALFPQLASQVSQATLERHAEEAAEGATTDAREAHRRAVLASPRSPPPPPQPQPQPQAAAGSGAAGAGGAQGAAPRRGWCSSVRGRADRGKGDGRREAHGGALRTTRLDGGCFEDLARARPAPADPSSTGGGADAPGKSATAAELAACSHASPHTSGKTGCGSSRGSRESKSSRRTGKRGSEVGATVMAGAVSSPRHERNDRNERNELVSTNL